MKNKKIISLVIIVVVVVLIVIVININRHAENVIKIGVLTPLSGPIAIAGEVQKNAISMATEDLKSKNINFDKYQFIYEDSKYDPKTALSGYESLKFKGVKIIIADGSPVVASIREKAVKDGILIFAQSATTPAFSDDSPLTCRVGLTADILGPSISSFAEKSLINKIAILIPNNEYGMVMKEAISKSFSGKITNVEVYDQASGDLKTNILKLIQNKSDIDALVVINNITPEPMFKQLKELGWNKQILSDIWTITSPNMKDRTLAKDVKFVDYIYTPQAELNSNAEALKYAKQYFDKYNASPILLGALTYDSVNILVDAIEKVGSDPQVLSKYFVDMSTYSGITGDIKFDSSCQNINTGIIWRQVMDDGLFVDIK